MPIRVVRVVGERVSLRVIQRDLHQVRVLRLVIEVLFTDNLIRIRIKLTKLTNQRTGVSQVRYQMNAAHL